MSTLAVRGRRVRDGQKVPIIPVMGYWEAGAGRLGEPRRRPLCTRYVTPAVRQTRIAVPSHTRELLGSAVELLDRQRSRFGRASQSYYLSGVSARRR